MSTLVYNLELTEPVKAIEEAVNFDAVQIYLHWRGQLINRFTLTNDHRPVGARRLTTELSQRFYYDILSRLYREYDPVTADYWSQMGVYTDNLLQEHLKLAEDETEIEPVPSEDLPELAKLFTASIVLCTLDRPQDLDQCLQELTRHKASVPYEIIVVDNNPASGLTFPIASKYPVKYISETRRGLSYARNAGLLIAHGNIIVCSDDDATVKEGWLDYLLEPFTDSQVMCVTGAILPRDLEATSAEYFEEYGGLFRGFERFEVSRENFFNRRRHVPTWEIGATANAAFRAEIFKNPKIGPFDEALGVGSPTGCSEDTYLFYKILKAGYKCIYEPKALVYHSHRRDMKGLRKQLYNYSKGHVAYNLLTFLNDGDFRALRYLFLSLPKKTLRRLWWSRKRYSFYPGYLIWLEILGYLNGPFALYKAQKRAKNLGITTAKDIEQAWLNRISESFPPGDCQTLTTGTTNAIPGSAF